MTSAVIRSATLDDVDAVVAFQTAAWREAYAGLVPSAYVDNPAVHERRRRRWQARLSGADSSSGRQCRLAVADGPAPDGAVGRAAVVGAVSWGPSRDDPPEPAVELMSLYVRQSHYGTGLGHRLLDTALGNVAASLWVFEDNVRALSFYRRYGFVADGAHAIDPGTGVAEIRLVR